MKIFITGASGFIGSNLIRVLLEIGADLTILALKNDPLIRLQGLEDRIKIMKGDLITKSFQKRFRSKTQR